VIVAESLSYQQILNRWQQLKLERESWRPHWKELSEFILPRSGRFFIQDRDKGQRRHNNIYDNTGTRALRVLAAGMMSGMTSPARPWFKLATPDEEMMDYAPVKLWLNGVTELMLSIFQRSNTYRALHSMYEELAVFGTAACIVTPDYANVIHHYPLTVGEYCIATDWKGDVTTLYREFQKPVHEVVAEFGYKSCSLTVQNLYDRGMLDTWVTLVHCIEPRSDRDPTKSDARNMAWRSVYLEIGNGNQDKFLRESGFRRFPALCPRWATAGGDIYGNSPGMEALGDIKQLQHEQLHKSKGIAQQSDPALLVPSSLKFRDVERMPGGVNFYDGVSADNTVKRLVEVDFNLEHLVADIQDVRGRIKGSFYADLFLMLANQTDSRMTATEVAERHEEKLLMLGPVLERLQNELLDPLIEMTFDAIVAAGIAPPIPQELQGHGINVELVSMLAQAQRAIGTNSVDRFVSSLGAVAQFKPEVLDKFDADKWADEYADMLGVTPEIFKSDEDVQAIREQRAQQAQAAQQAALINQGADTAQKLAAAKTSEPSALTDATRAFSGYS
jgi:hypothetical protein